MAVVNFYDTPLSQVATSKKVRKGVTVQDSINKYLDERGVIAETYEVYNTETGETTFETVTPDGYKVVTVVNGEEKPLDYTIQKDDVISVIFMPQANSTGWDWLSFIGSALMVVVGIFLIETGYGVPLIVGGVMGMLASGITMLTRTDDQNMKTDKDKLETEAALTINGAENPMIGDNRFPFVFGKIATNPYIIGSSYHQTYTRENGKHEAQYMSALYCVGYGPLKLTDFKIAETVLCYNRPRDVEGERDNPTVMHGLIDSHTEATVFDKGIADTNGYYVYIKERDAYLVADPQPTEDSFGNKKYHTLNYFIPPKWKNNDVKIEILQRGTKDEEDLTDIDKWGTLYNKTVIEDQVNANILFIHDEDISAAAEKHYKGTSVPKGFRTNTVRLSQNCPMHLEVELDFPSSIYAGRTKKTKTTSKMVYYDIPIRYAIQWRPVYKNNPVSDADDGKLGGWKSFDYMMLGDTPNTWVVPTPYEASDAYIDMALNAGSSDENYSIYREQLSKYANEVMYKQYHAQVYNKCIADAQYARPYNSGVSYYTQEQKRAIGEGNASSEAKKMAENWIDVHDITKIEEAARQGYISEATYNKEWIGVDVFNVNPNKSYSKEWGVKEFNGDERLHVFCKDFTKEEIDEILAADADYVEVRVIRLTPCYLDQSGTDNETYGDFSYQDLGKWSYLRTTVFDKDAYEEAKEKDPDADPLNFPLRPIKEDDLKKFTFVAVRLKQDVAETGGSSLHKLRLLAQSFSPVYDKEEKKWLPEGLEKSQKYYQKIRNEKGEWEIIELTQEQYADKVLAKEPYLSKMPAGNNFVQLMADKIFSEKAKLDSTPFQKYQLIDDLENNNKVTIHNDTNTASSVLLGLVGPHMGDEAKTFENVNMTSATELYEFCEDVTDGTPYEGPEAEKPADGLLHIKYSCNGILTEQQKLEETVKQMLLTGRSVLKRDDDNRYEFLIGKEVKYVMTVLNNKNVISKSNTRSFQEIPSGLQTVFPDEDDDYTQNPIYIMDKGESWKNPSKPIEQFSLRWVTNRQQMWSLGCYNLAGRLLQRESYTRTVGKLGLTVSLGDVLLIQDDSLLVGTDNGARIRQVIENDGKIYGFITDEPYEYTGELKDGQSVQGVTIVQPGKYGASRCVTLRLATPEGNEFITADNIVIGLTNVVALAHPIIISEDGNYSEESVNENGEFCTLDPKEGDLVAFGIMTKITQKAQLMGIKPSGGKYSLTLVPYDDSYYHYGKALPVFNPNMTLPKREGDDFEFTNYATKADVADATAVNDENKVDLTVDLSATVDIKTCLATRDGIQLIADTRDLDGNKLNPVSIKWTFYREDVVSDYIESDPQPTEVTDFDEEEYYVLDGESYVRANSYTEGVTYYSEEATVIDTKLFEQTTTEESFSFLFDRASPVSKLGGYPEYYDLYPFKITATAKLTVSSETSESFFRRIDTDAYGTWIPGKPVVDVSVQDRTAILTFSQPSTQRVLYGTDSLTYRVQIRRLFDGGSENFAKPNIESSPYVEFNTAGNMIKRNESAYKVFVKAEPQPDASTDFTKNEYYLFLETKEVEGVEKKWLDYERVYSYSEGVEYYVASGEEVTSSNIFTQTLPLSGQGDADSVATTYEYRVRAVSISGAYTEYTENVQVRALVTNIRDIVRANATAKEEYVVSLSAISAKLGDITDGSLTGSELNYWTLSSKENAKTEPGEDNRNYQGAFRVGGENQYLKVIPVPREDGTGFIDYQIDFKVGNFTLNSTNTEFNNVLYFYEDSDFTNHGHEGIPPYHTKRLKVTSQGLVVQLNNGTADEGPNSEWTIAGQVTLDTKGNLIVSNTDESDPNFPKFRIPINGSTVYHFDNTLTDEQGNNSADLNFDYDTDNPFIADASSPIPESDAVYSGKISKNIRSISNDVLFFCKKSSVRIGDDVITDSVETARNYNSLDKAMFGNKNLPSDLFKYKE